MATWAKKEVKEKASKDSAREAELSRRGQFGSHPDAIPSVKIAKGDTISVNFTLKSNG